MDKQSMDFALKLLLDDIAELEEQRKGKQTAGQLNDLEYALACMRENLLAAQTSIHDRKLALSTTKAASTDQEILEFLKNDDLIAQRDHEYARALNRSNRNNIPFRRFDNGALASAKDDSISLMMGDLMNYIVQEDQPGSGEGPSFPSSSSKPQARKKCASCLEICEEITFIAVCGHGYCYECTRNLLLVAIRDETLYPPRCCRNVMRPMVVLSVLSYDELVAFSEKAVEYMTVNRLYCAEKTCSAFIPPSRIKDENGTCLKCNQQTHQPCHSFAHPGYDCPMEVGLNEVLDMAEERRWQRCAGCRRMVELAQGCNHITCVCGYDFCYVCGLIWKTCQCDVWHEDMLYHRAHQRMNHVVPPNARNEDRQAAYNQIRDNLLNHEEVGCNHHLEEQWEWYPDDEDESQCEICHDLLDYIFVCRNCHMGACLRCRRNRVR
ncbi:hypothetical protein N7540_000872 [Penicillium herquei]|nr:hypothetical protein N7540_000872 [Penicillium herquei]